MNNWSKTGVKTLLQAQEENRKFEETKSKKVEENKTSQQKFKQCDQREYKDLDAIYENIQNAQGGEKTNESGK